MKKVKTMPCEICGKPTKYLNTRKCNNCWEISRRIDEYLISQKGRWLIREKMDEYTMKTVIAYDERMQNRDNG